MFENHVGKALITLILLQIVALQSLPSPLQDVMQERSITSYVKDVASGFLSRVTSTATSVFENALMKLIDRIDDKCESNDKLRATRAGKKSCRERCTGIGAHIEEVVIKASGALATIFGNRKWFTIVPNDNPKLPIYKCVPNVTRDAILCTCPRAPKLVITTELQTNINGYLSSSQTKSYNAPIVINPLAPLNFVVNLFFDTIVFFHDLLVVLFETVTHPIRNLFNQPP